MTRKSWVITGLVLLLLAGTAFGQSTGSTITAGSQTSGASTTSGTSVGDTVKQGLRSVLMDVLVTAIQGVFQDLRTSLGLPAVATGLTTDPLSIIESTIINAIRTLSTQQTSNQ